LPTHWHLDLADGVYERLYYEEPTAHGAAQASRHLRALKTASWWRTVFKFSDDWLAPGLAGAAAFATPEVGKLVEFNTSCAPVFIQRASNH
jgi:hypothetical protein